MTSSCKTDHWVIKLSDGGKFPWAFLGDSVLLCQDFVKINYCWFIKWYFLIQIQIKLTHCRPSINIAHAIIPSWMTLTWQFVASAFIHCIYVIHTAIYCNSIISLFLIKMTIKLITQFDLELSTSTWLIWTYSFYISNQ